MEGEITGEDGKAKGVSFPAGRGRREQDTAAGQRTADAGGSVGAAQPQRQGHERADASSTGALARRNNAGRAPPALATPMTVRV